MYSNERGSRFNLLDLLIRIIFFVLFVLVLLWLFPKVPNMTPFYSNVFRENISYMQEAGEAYFTDDKMPKEVGETVKIALVDMLDKKLVLPFVDKDGNQCNQYDSYVSVTKELDGSYSLKTNLICGTERDFVVKILGCHNYCKDNNCEKVCHKEQITMYQFKKAVTKTISNYTCPSGYARDGKICKKTVLVDTKSAEVTTVIDQTLTMPAKLVTVPGTTVTLQTIKTKLDPTDWKAYDDVVVNTTASTTKQEAYSCPKQSCTTVSSPSYSCNCTTTWYRGEAVTSCSTCGGGSYESCTTVSGTCYRTVTVPGSTTYSCPSNSTASAGSGSSLTCWHIESRDSGYKYSCPLDATNFTGSGESLKCFKTTKTRTYYECTDKTYTLYTDVCKKKVTGTSTEYKCDAGYVLEGKICNKYSTETKNASVTTSTSTSYKYTWSEKTSLSGWIKTGKTKTVEGKEICE